MREEGFDCTMSSNAALLDESRAHALLEAGLQRIAINVGDRDADYEDIYKLPFERTRDNVLRFKELAGDACEVIIVLVDHRRDRAHLESMRQYWGDFGMRAFMEYEIMNRGGALFVDHMQFEEYPQLAEAREMLNGRGIEAVCPTPFAYLFIGYDGQYYLCCSDWKKEVPLGSVADTSFADVMVAKLEHARTRQPVCKTCNLDPLNKLTEALRGTRRRRARRARRRRADRQDPEHDDVLAHRDRGPDRSPAPAPAPEHSGAAPRRAGRSRSRSCSREGLRVFVEAHVVGVVGGDALAERRLDIPVLGADVGPHLVRRAPTGHQPNRRADLGDELVVRLREADHVDPGEVVLRTGEARRRRSSDRS